MTDRTAMRLGMGVLSFCCLIYTTGAAHAFELSLEEWKARCPAIVTGKDLMDRGISNEPIKRPAPRYPSSTNKPGEIELHLRIDPNGSVVDVDVVRASDPAFGPVAIKAVKRWRYPRVVIEGRAVCVEERLVMHFEPGRR